MDAVTKTIEFEFLKRDFRQVAVGYVVACIGMVAFAARTAKLENKLSNVEHQKIKLEESNQELSKDVAELRAELAEFRSKVGV